MLVVPQSPCSVQPAGLPEWLSRLQPGLCGRHCYLQGVSRTWMPTGRESVFSPALQFNKILDPANVKRIVEEADGYQPHLIAPQMGYRRLLQECLVSLPPFSGLQACADHEECTPVPYQDPCSGQSRL